MIKHKQLRRALANKNMTQRELARQLDTTVEYVSKYCNEDCEIRDGRLKKMCEILDCEPKDLWYE